MSLPITSRIKRTPILKRSMAKKTTDPKAKKYGSEEGDDITTTEIVETPKKSLQDAYKDRSSEYKDLSFEEYKKVAQADPLYGTSGGKKEITTTKKGEDLDYDTNLMKTKKEGTMLEPWEVRRQLRAQTRSDRQVNKKRRKMEKYGTFDKEGNFTQNKGLTQKELRKLQQAETGYDTATAMSSNIQKGVKSGRAAGEQYYQGQREMNKGEQTPAEQLESSKQEAKRARRAEIAAASGMTTSQAEGAVEAGATPFSGMMETAKELGEVDLYKPGQYSSGFTSKSTPFQMQAKSPATKKLRGAQNTLPQHLQNAIKAAPGKMRSGFKMKGYGKK